VPADAARRPRVAVAAPNALAAAAGTRLADQGGNAVDAAVAAMLVTCVTEPGLVSLGGGAFLTLAVPGEPVVTVDGYVEMPGRGLPPHAFGRGTRDVVTTYGGRTAMTVGAGSVATPGAIAALELAQRRSGRVPWALVVEPAVEVARDGFPMGRANDYYFSHVRDAVFSADPEVSAALHHRDGTPLRTGDRMHVPHLAEFLERVAVQGADALHRGDVARALAEDMAQHGGLVTERDLAEFTPVVRAATQVPVGPWLLSTNPPPAIGGPVLAAMLLLLDGRPRSRWTGDDHRHLVAVLRAVLEHRAHELDVAGDRAVAGRRLLDDVRERGQTWLTAAPSTVHVSAVGADGTACAVTASAGYGSGTTAPGTGVWLNNCLGEHELNRGGLHSLEPGERLASNMAPTVGRHPDGATLAIGSPGADRITSALTQVLASLAHGGYDLQAAVDLPRLHLSRSADGEEVLHVEADLELPADLGPGGVLTRQEHDAHAMFFGGVGAAMLDADGALSAAADPRRAGATSVG